MKIKEDLIENLDWNKNIKNREEKEVIAKEIASKVKNGQVIGFGSGTTSFLAAKEIGIKCEKENLKITAIPTSNQIELLCNYLNIKIAKLEECQMDWAFDGADEVDENNWLIKGQGAAMYKEKLNILKSPITYILIDESKLVNRLGEKFPVPVECDKSKIESVKDELIKLGATKCEYRKDKDENLFVTENDKYIIDAFFDKIEENYEEVIRNIDGVLESGLFINYKNIEIYK